MNMTTVPSNQLKAMQHEIADLKEYRATQELVIQQLRDALEKIACVGNGNTHGNSVGNCLAIEALAIPTSTEHLEAWYKEMVGEAVGYCLGAEHFSYIKCWPTGRTQLHAIKPFPFNEE